MTICGYNQKMGDGLEVLFQGMYEAVAQKALQEGIEISAVLERELVEIPCINLELKRSFSPELQMFCGLNDIAMPFFAEVLEHIRSGKDPRTSFSMVLQEFVSTLEHAEGESEKRPQVEGKENVQGRAKALGKWIRQKFDPEVK